MNTALAQALLAFQGDPPPVHLDATNPHFKNKYASLGGVVAAIRPALNKHGLAYTQVPTTLDGQPALRTSLIHAESGETLSDIMPLLLVKQDPQGYGSALTYARRYALLSVLGLVGDEDDDANAATPRETDPHGLKSSRADAAGPIGDPGEVVLTFGKHKDKSIKDVPREYLTWWIGQEPRAEQASLRAAVEAYLNGDAAPTAASGEFSDDDVPFQRTFA